MLHYLKRFGNNYGILDTDDGSIDWISFQSLKEYAQTGGLTISGVDPATMTLTPHTVQLPPEKCNWADGKNIFSAGAFMTVNLKGGFKLQCSGRRLTGFVCCDPAVGNAWLEFAYGVEVPITMKEYDTLMSFDREGTIEVLKRLGGQQ